MAMDYAALKSEIQNDPVSLGYSTHVAIGNDVPIADLLNEPTEILIDLPSIAKDNFLLGVAPATFVLPSLSQELQAKWDRVLSLAQSVSSINVASSTVQALFQAAIADGVLTQDQIDGFTKRFGSRAEVLFGAGAIVSHLDVSKALRG